MLDCRTNPGLPPDRPRTAAGLPPAGIKRQPAERVVKDFDALVPEIKKAYPSVTKVAQYGFCWVSGGLIGFVLVQLTRCLGIELFWRKGKQGAARLLFCQWGWGGGLDRFVLGGGARKRSARPLSIGRMFGEPRRADNIRTPPPRRALPSSQTNHQGGLFTALLSSGKAPKVDAAVAFHPSLLVRGVQPARGAGPGARVRNKQRRRPRKRNASNASAMQAAAGEGYTGGAHG